MAKNIVKSVGLLLMVALLAFLIPATTLVEVWWPIEDSILGHNDPLLSLGAFRVTPFSLCMTVGAALGLIVSLTLARKRVGTSPLLTTALLALPCALIGGHLVFCFTQLGSILGDYESMGGASLILRLNEGGYTLYGAVLGTLVALPLAAKLTGRNAGALADCAMPAAAITLFFGRLGDLFIMQSLGPDVETPALQRFPLAICTAPDPDYPEWARWQIPVFAYEMLAAAIILIVAVVLLCRGARAGRTTQVTLALLSLSQIICESLRRDEFIRFGFVRFSQLAAAVVIAAVLAQAVITCVRSRGWSAWQIVRIVLFALCVGMVILLEFALDKSPIDNRLLYGVMTATLVLMGFAVLFDGRKKVA